MSQRLLLRMVIKLFNYFRGIAIYNPDLIQNSFGHEGLVTLLEGVDGADADSVLRKGGARVGEHARISRGLTIHNANGNFNNLQIGNDCHIGRQTFIDLAAPVVIGNRVTISMRCNFITHVNVGDSQCGIETRTDPICIEDDVYIGAGVTILAGIRLGAKSIVGAGAVVTRNVDNRQIVVGVPARPLVCQ